MAEQGPWRWWPEAPLPQALLAPGTYGQGDPGREVSPPHPHSPSSQHVVQQKRTTRDTHCDGILSSGKNPRWVSAQAGRLDGIAIDAQRNLGHLVGAPYLPLKGRGEERQEGRKERMIL